MKKLRWQILIVVLALVAIAILLLGQQPVLQAGVAEPTTGGVYIEGLVGSIERLNPLLDFYNPADGDVDSLIYDSLIDFDEHGNPLPGLAETWGVSVDGTAYNLTLREDALWHDGEPVTAADVLFTIEMMRNPEMPTPPDLRALWEEVEVERFGDYNLQFRLEQPFAPFLDYLTFGIVPEHLLQDLNPADLIDAQFNLAPVGSGPYRFEQLLVEDGEIAGVVLGAFEDHYAGRPFIDQFIFRYFPDAEEALEAYRAGEILGISQATRDALPEVLREPALNLYSGGLPQLAIMFLNLDNSDVPFFQDVTVRKALLMGTNRQRLVDSILEGQGVVAHGPIFPGTWAYYDGVEKLSYDPDQAISMLKSEGYVIPAEGGAVREKDGVRLSFDLVHPDTEEHTAIAEAIEEDWAALGVRVNLVAVDYETLMEDYLDPRSYEAALVDLNLAGSPDPDPYPFWHQAQATGGQNYSGWDDRRASEYLEAARTTVNRDQRERLYRNFQVHFAREMPALPLFYPVYSYAVDSQVQGVAMGPLFEPSDRLLTATEWFLVAGGPAAETEAITPEETESP